MRELTAFTTELNTSVLVSGSIASGSALVNRHACAWDGTNTEGKGSTRGSLRVATKVRKAIDTRVRLGSDRGRAVEYGEFRGSSARFCCVSFASHVALGILEFDGRRGNALTTKTLLCILCSSILKASCGTKGDTGLVGHVHIVGIGGGANGSVDLGIASIVFPSAWKIVGEYELGKSKW